MKVGFYVGDIDLRNGGIAPYAQRVLRALNDYRFRRDVSVIVIGRDPSLVDGSTLPWLTVPNRFEDTRLTQLRRRIAEAVDVLRCRVPATAQIWKNRPLCEYLEGLKLDVLHVPYQTPPFYGLSLPTIVTIHDVQEIHLPEYFTAEDRRDRAIGQLNAIRDAAAVVVSFEHVKRDLIRYFGCAEDQVVILPLPIGQCGLRSPSEAQASAYRQKYASYPDFFLYPAQTWEHKNHLRLVRAFDVTCRRSSRTLSLVCTGRKNEFHARIAAELAQTSARDRVVFTDIVEETELRWLYEHCLSVVIPTLYEAGSFPLIEAMQIGSAVVCASTTSLPDTIGDSRFLFDPRSVEQMADAMVRLAEDEGFRMASIENCRRRADEMNKQNVGEYYEQLWLRVVERRKCGLAGLFRRAACF